MFRLIDEIERLRRFPTKDELELIADIIEVVKESPESNLIEETADGDGNINLDSFRNLAYGLKEKDL